MTDLTKLFNEKQAQVKYHPRTHGLLKSVVDFCSVQIDDSIWHSKAPLWRRLKMLGFKRSVGALKRSAAYGVRSVRLRVGMRLMGIR